MSGSINQVTLLGNLCSDPEVRSFQNGGKVCNIRLATNESWKDKGTGERKEHVEYHSVSIFSDGLVNVAERFLRKGSKVLVQGKLTTRRWQDQSGADRYSTEIALQGFDAKLVMLDGPSENRGSQQRDEPAQDTRGNGGPRNNQRGGFGDRVGGAPAFDDDLNDDVPFLTRNGIW